MSDPVAFNARRFLENPRIEDIDLLFELVPFAQGRDEFELLPLVADSDETLSRLYFLFSNSRYRDGFLSFLGSAEGADFKAKLLSDPRFIPALCALRAAASGDYANVSVLYLLLFCKAHFFWSLLNDPVNADFKAALLSDSLFIEALCARRTDTNLSALLDLVKYPFEDLFFKLLNDPDPVSVDFKKKLFSHAGFIPTLCALISLTFSTNHSVLYGICFSRASTEAFMRILNDPENIEFTHSLLQSDCFFEVLFARSSEFCGSPGQTVFCQIFFHGQGRSFLALLNDPINAGFKAKLLSNDFFMDELFAVMNAFVNSNEDFFIDALFALRFDRHFFQENLPALYSMLYSESGFEDRRRFLTFLNNPSNACFKSRLLSDPRFIPTLCAFRPRRTNLSLLSGLCSRRETAELFMAMLSAPENSEFKHKLLESDYFLDALFARCWLPGSSLTVLSHIFLRGQSSSFFELLNDSSNVDFKMRLLSDPRFIEALYVSPGGSAALSLILSDHANRTSFFNFLNDPSSVDFRTRFLSDPRFIHALYVSLGGPVALSLVLSDRESRNSFFKLLNENEDFKIALLRHKDFKRIFFGELKKNPDFISVTLDPSFFETLFPLEADDLKVFIRLVTPPSQYNVVGRLTSVEFPVCSVTGDAGLSAREGFFKFIFEQIFRNDVRFLEIGRSYISCLVEYFDVVKSNCNFPQWQSIALNDKGSLMYQVFHAPKPALGFFSKVSPEQRAALDKEKLALDRLRAMKPGELSLSSGEVGIEMRPMAGAGAGRSS